MVGFARYGGDWLCCRIELEIHPVQTQAAVDIFWAPVLHDQRMVLICAGGVVFKKNNFSGVIMAGKDIEYPFVSMQTALGSRK